MMTFYVNGKCLKRVFVKMKKNILQLFEILVYLNIKYIYHLLKIIQRS